MGPCNLEKSHRFAITLAPTLESDLPAANNRCITAQIAPVRDCANDIAMCRGCGWTQYSRPATGRGQQRSRSPGAAAAAGATALLGVCAGRSPLCSLPGSRCSRVRRSRRAKFCKQLKSEMVFVQLQRIGIGFACLPVLSSLRSLYLPTKTSETSYALRGRRKEPAALGGAGARGCGEEHPDGAAASRAGCRLPEAGAPAPRLLPSSSHWAHTCPRELPPLALYDFYRSLRGRDATVLQAHEALSCSSPHV